MRHCNIRRFRHSHVKNVNVTNIYNIQMNDNCQYIEHQINYKGKEDEKCLDKE